jgi:hypothetical protein
MAFASVSSEEYQEKKSNSTLCSCFLYATPLPVRGIVVVVLLCACTVNFAFTP